MRAGPGEPVLSAEGSAESGARQPSSAGTISRSSAPPNSMIAAARCSGAGRAFSGGGGEQAPEAPRGQFLGGGPARRRGPRGVPRAPGRAGGRGEQRAQQRRCGLTCSSAASSASISISSCTASRASREVGSQGRAWCQESNASTSRSWRWSRWARSWAITARSPSASRASTRPRESTVTGTRKAGQAVGHRGLVVEHDAFRVRGGRFPSRDSRRRCRARWRLTLAAVISRVKTRWNPAVRRC